MTLADTDIINSAFYLINCIYWFANIRAILRDKKIDGFVWHIVAFFFVWSVWDLFYLIIAKQQISFYIQLISATEQLIYVALCVRLIYKKKTSAVPI